MPPNIPLSDESRVNYTQTGRARLENLVHIYSTARQMKNGPSTTHKSIISSHVPNIESHAKINLSPSRSLLIHTAPNIPQPESTHGKIE